MPSINGIKSNGVAPNGATFDGVESTNFHVVLTGRHQVVLEDRPVPRCKPGHVLVKVIITGICGSDYSFYSKGGIGNFTVEKPLVLGHESCGVIYEVGEDVTTLFPGDRVAIEPAFPCRVCRDCRTGHSNYCRDLAYMATPPTDGTLCQWYLCPIPNAVKLPSKISWREAACIQPLAVAVHAMSRAKVTAHQNIAVFGSGALGLVCMAVAKALGARTILAVDISRSRLEFAVEYAATHAHLAGKRDANVSVEEFVKHECSKIVQHTGLDAFDVVIEASGAEQSMYTGLELLRPGGTFLQAGLGSAKNTLPFLQVATKELDVYGTLRYTAGCFENGIDFVERELVNLQPLVTRVYPLSQSEEAFAAVKEGREIKIAILNQEIDN